MSATRRRRLGLLVAGLVLGGLSFELLLQGLALWQWTQRRGDGGLDPGAPVVLCVGDSFTYGLGASAPEHAYPERLEATLRAALGGPVEVVNGGWSGHTSRDVLLRLPAQLERFRPRVVCILIGLNDLGWSPPRVTAAEEASAPAEEAFAWRWRLPRLAHAIAEWLWHGGPAYSRQATARAPDLLGVWHADGEEVRFEPDGRLLTRVQAMTWRMQGERLWLRFPDAPEFDAQATLAEAALELTLPGFPRRLRLIRGPAPRPPALLAADRELAAGRPEVALVAYRAVDSAGESAHARFGLVRCLLRLGRPQEAQAEALALEQRVRTGDLPATGPAMRALCAVGWHRRALELMIGLEPQPFDLHALPVLVELSEEPSTYAGIVAAIDASLLEQTTHAPMRARLLHIQHLSLCATDPAAALRALLEAELLVSASGYTMLRLQQDCFTDAMVAEALDALQATPAQRAHVLALRAAETEEVAAASATLAHHLRRIVARCRAASAAPLLVGYPFPVRQHQQVAQEVAAELLVPLVATQERFAALQLELGWEGLFVVDGHCNDRGYAEVAEAVTPVVVGTLK